jgi:hypothetical protein
VILFLVLGILSGLAVVARRWFLEKRKIKRARERYQKRLPEFQRAAGGEGLPGEERMPGNRLMLLWFRLILYGYVKREGSRFVSGDPEIARLANESEQAFLAYRKSFSRANEAASESSDADFAAAVEQLLSDKQALAAATDNLKKVAPREEGFSPFAPGWFDQIGELWGPIRAMEYYDQYCRQMAVR